MGSSVATYATLPRQRLHYTPWMKVGLTALVLELVALTALIASVSMGYFHVALYCYGAMAVCFAVLIGARLADGY